MASVAYMRDKLKEVYSGPDWVLKVDNMSNKQVLAVYTRLVKQGAIKV